MVYGDKCGPYVCIVDLLENSLESSFEYIWFFSELHNLSFSFSRKNICIWKVVFLYRNRAYIWIFLFILIIKSFYY